MDPIKSPTPRAFDGDDEQLKKEIHRVCVKKKSKEKKKSSFAIFEIQF